MKYDNTTLVNPLVEGDSELVKRVLYHAKPSSWDGSDAVDRLVIPAHQELELQGTQEFKELQRQFPDEDDQQHEIAKSCCKFYIGQQQTEYPHREHIIQTERRELTGLWAPEVTRCSSNVMPICDRMTESMQWTSDTQLRYSMELLEGWMGSDAFHSKDGGAYAERFETVAEELKRVGDSVFYPTVRRIDKRGRRYNHMSNCGWQTESHTKGLIDFANAEECTPDVFWSITNGMAGLHANNWEAILSCGSVSQCIDKYGYGLVRVALKCKEYAQTGKTTLAAEFDQGCSGQLFQALIEKSMSGMRLGNLFGGKRRDAYIEMCRWINSMDNDIELDDSLRTTAKRLARGGQYEAGVAVMATHLLGLDPDKMERLYQEDRVYLLDHVEYPSWVPTHPDFVHLFTKKGTLRAAVTYEELYDVAKKWVRNVGAPAMHEVIPEIRSLGQRSRNANEHCVETTGKMIELIRGDGQVIPFMPYSRLTTEPERTVRGSVNGRKGKATYTPFEVEMFGSISCHLAAIYDSYFNSELNLENKSQDWHQLDNHDGFLLQPSRVGRFFENARNVMVRIIPTMEATLAPLWEANDVEPPSGPSYAEIAEMIPPVIRMHHLDTID